MFNKFIASAVAAAALAAAPAAAIAAPANQDHVKAAQEADLTAHFDVVYLGTQDGFTAGNEFDILANDDLDGLRNEFLEIVIEDQPFGGHRVETMPHMFPLMLREGEDIDYQRHEYAVFELNEADVTDFVGTTFTYHLVNTVTGEASNSTMVLVLP